MPVISLIHNAYIMSLETNCLNSAPAQTRCVLASFAQPKGTCTTCCSLQSQFLPSYAAALSFVSRNLRPVISFCLVAFTAWRERLRQREEQSERQGFLICPKTGLSGPTPQLNSLKSGSAVAPYRDVLSVCQPTRTQFHWPIFQVPASLMADEQWKRSQH